LIERLRLAVDARPRPLTVALDGRSGGGKTTLAASVAEHLDVTVVGGDDFYAGGTAAEWDAMSPAERAAHCIDWRRQRSVLEALAAGQDARWDVYDWEAFDDSFAPTGGQARPAPIVLLEGVYSARPELADLCHLRVLLDVGEAVRRERVRVREGEHFDPAWDARWSSAEDHYFGLVMPPAAFDLVIGQDGDHETAVRP
jgi:uridine kinase